jgi:putative transposase
MSQGLCLRPNLRSCGGLNELHLDYPFAGSRMLRDLLCGEDIAIGRELVATMMRRMRIETLYRPA